MPFHFDHEERSKVTKKRVTLRDVAEAAGVHPSTVSRALDPRTRSLVNDVMAQRIAAISQRLNYRPNAAAFSLRTNRSRTVGVIVPNIENAVFPPMIRGVESALLAQGYQVILGNSDGDENRERDLINNFTSRGIDGLVISQVSKDNTTIRDAAFAGTPVVTVSARTDNPAISSVVHMDNKGVLRAMTHLVSLGHRRIAFIGGPISISSASARFKAYEEHRKTLGVIDDPRLVCFGTAYTEAEGESCVEELIAHGAQFTAIMCANDRLALGTITALERSNLSCPRDVSVTGFNDIPLVDRIQPSLTTVRTQKYQMGVEAGKIILASIEGNSEPQHLVLPVELIIRGSTQAVSPPRSG